MTIIGEIFMIKFKSTNIALAVLLMLSVFSVSADTLTFDESQSASSSTGFISESSASPNNPTPSINVKDASANEPSSNSSVNDTTSTTEQSISGDDKLSVESGIATVHNDTEYWVAIADQSVSKIILANDITAQESARIGNGNIQRSLTIDGGGHNLSYIMTSYDPAVLYTNADGITINIQNISIGSTVNPGNSWYGIVRVLNQNVTMNVSNVNYYATYGAQPFYANGNAGTVLNFDGTNSFKLGNGSANYGGEFVERFQTINFKTGSSTSVDQNTGDASAIFWGINGTNINVQANANLSVRSNKPNLLYNNPTLNILDNATFTYESYKGMSYTTPNLANSSKTVINASPNSAINLISNDYSIGLSNIILNANSPKSIYAVNNKNIAATSGSMTLNRTDSGKYPYTIQTLSTANVQTTGKDNILANTTFVLNSSTGMNGKSWVYTTTPTIDSAKFDSQVGSKLSNLTGTIIGSPNTARNVKVSTSKLYTGTDITTVAAQAQIDNSTVSAQTISGNDLAIIGSNISGGKLQYIYYNIQDVTAYPGFVLKSKWVEAQKEQDIYQEITIPDKSLTFDQPIPGLFNYASDYKVYNSGNVPVNLSVASITNYSTNVGLVETGSSFDSEKQEASLKLQGTSTTSSTSWDFKNPGTSKLQLDSYFNTNNVANLNIGGNYSGPLIGQLPVAYTINFNVTKVN